MSVYGSFTKKEKSSNSLHSRGGVGEEEENWREKNRGVGGGEGMPAVKTPIGSFLRLLAAGNPIELQHSAKISPTLSSNDALPPIK